MEGSRWQFEIEAWNKGYRVIAGVDEAGRGPLAGPVIAAAVLLPPSWLEIGETPEAWRALTDSKQLSPQQREKFFEQLHNTPNIHLGIGQVDAERIDTVNILNATHEAMRLALEQLSRVPDCVLVDGRPVNSLPYPQFALPKGDARSYSIAAASVIAKVTRDRLMARYETDYPGYGFARHKGYPTKSHLAAIQKHGPSPLHRKSFAPLRQQD